MDLVDIDKVLDDLELNEDEKQQQAAKSGGVAPARKQLAPIAAETNNNNGGNKAATNSKTFVNITNVFSSLNEYVNVDIEHSIKESAVRPQAENYRGMFDSRSGARENDDEEEEEEEDRTDEDPDGLLTSASSITTSSPSSFSSGPSPGTSSETASFISEEKPRLARDGTGDDDDDETKQEDDGATENDSETTNLIDEDCRRRERIDKDVDVNSGELGLSSLSSCLYNENTSSSLPGLSHDLIKIDALCSMSSSSVQQKDDEPDDESIDLPKPIEQADWPRRAPAANEPYKEPAVIGFGSTMDEISDTELDSILQEIDSDLQAAFKEDPEPQSVAEEAVAADEKELEAPPVAAAPIATTIVAKKIPDLDDDDHENLPNADSFSQASTIEFAESRLQSDFGTDTIGAAAINEEDRSTSSNSGTKNEEQPEDSPQNDEAAAAATVKVIQRPNSLDLPVQSADINSTAGQTPPAFRSDDVRTNAIATSSSDDLSPYPTTGAEEEAAVVCAPTTPSPNPKIGKTPPFWIPDSEAASCMQCKLKFSLLKRRHHCRACGQVLCSACCSQKGRLEFLGDADVRICIQCHLILSGNVATMATEATAAAAATPSTDEDTQSSRPPNPNNPMEYCSMIPPHQQVSAAGGSVAKPTNPISVMVPVGVLKREGVPPKNSRKDKNVIFSDGIRPGCDLTELDDSWHEKGASGSGGTGRKSSSSSGTSGKRSLQNSPANSGIQRGRSKLATAAPQSYLPDGPNELPPIYTKNITNVELTEVKNNGSLMTRLQTETLQFTIQRNFYIYVKIMNLKCCINKTVINFTTHGMHAVGQDEIIILLEHDDSATTHDEFLPKDIFTHLNEIYNDAEKGHPISEMGFSVPNAPNFLGSREHGGFLYIRSTFQCLQEIHLPHAPFLIGILIHRWEMPWAKIFPLRLMLRLGAQYRYYPSPHVSIRGRDSVYAEIAQTIINFLADFRNYSYTLATIRGMYIHMEDRKTSVLIPKNRFEQIVKALNNSSDHILALGGNFSKKADGHLVCIQNMESDCPETHTYSTQAINIQGQPRQVTGASFLVLNGALKTTSGLSGKCSIVEDGLMVQILPAKMTLVRNALKNMQNTEIVCGPVDANESQTEIVSIIWTENDVEFNIGVTSPIDGRKMDGIPSIRVHSGLNYSNASHTIRWTEVFIIQSVDDESLHGKEPIDTSKLSEQIAKSTSTALVSFLDLLAASGCVKIGLRATLHQDNVCYEAGSLNTKLAPLYMNALDNALIPTLHRQIITLQAVENPIILELIFHILDF